MKQLPKHSNSTFVQLLDKLDYKRQSTNDINITTNKNIQLYSDRTRLITILQNFNKIFKYFKVKYFILVLPVHQAPFLLFIVHP